MTDQRPFPLAIRDTRIYLDTLQSRLPMFTVTDHPTDYPEYFVARLSLTIPKPEVMPFAIMDRDLDALRATMEALGLVKIMRNDGDDPVILETWL